MTAGLDALASTRAIVVSGILMLVLGAAFVLLTPVHGGELLDAALDGDAAHALLARLGPDQRRGHLWTTLVLDSAYPLAYGAFFAGLLARCHGTRRALAVTPAALAVTADFLENAVQALALAGVVDWLDAKDLLTPLKFGALLVAVALVLGCGVRAAVRRAAGR